MRPLLASPFTVPWRPARIRSALSGARRAAGRRDRRTLLTLAIETSCDDTCVAVLDKTGPAARLLFHRRETADSRAYGGIHPAAAVASHGAVLASLVRDALPALPRPPDLVAVTRGPGMPASLATGLNTAKGLAVAWGAPLVGVHHMQAHALTPRLVDALARGRAVDGSPGGAAADDGAGPAPAFPFLTLLVSGGHTLLLSSRALTAHRVLAEAANMAIGDMLDKVGRALAPPPADDPSAPQVPFAVQLERLAFPGGAADMAAYYTAPARRRDELAVYTAASGAWRLAPPLRDSRAMRFDFSTLHRDARSAADGAAGAEAGELARETLRLAFEHLAGRVVFALDDELASRGGDSQAPATTTLVLSGGVAGSAFLRFVLRAVLDARGHGSVRIVAPPVELCTDNAAMVAWAGAEMFEAGWRTGLGVAAVRKWSLDPDADDGGIPGAEGWERKGAL